VPRLLKPGVRSVVLDCEAVAFDRELGKILPFQARPRARARATAWADSWLSHARCLPRSLRASACSCPALGSYMPLLM